MTTTRTETDTDILIDRMIRTMYHLTPREVDRLNVCRPLTEAMRLAICQLVEGATVWHYDDRDVPHYAGNVFESYFDNNPEYGPQPACMFCQKHPCDCNDEVPF